MKSLHGGIPLAVLAAVARAQLNAGSHPGDTTLIGGPSGVDVGNAAAVPFSNHFSSTYDENYKDDHSVDIDTSTTVKVPPPHPHHGPKGRPHDDHHGHHGGPRVKRGNDKPTLIGGSSGVDVGNSANVPTVNSFSSSFKGDYVDDHSVELESEAEVHVYPPHRGHRFHGPKHHPRGNGGVGIGGPGGVDVGNSANVPTVNSFSSSFKGDYTDDHSVELESEAEFHVYPPHHGPKHHPRGHGGVGIGGPGGVDVGSSAAVPTFNKFSSSVTENYKDDHSVEIEEEVEIWKHGHHDHPGHRSHGPKHHPRGHGGVGIGGPGGVDIGNSAAVPTVNTATSKFHETSVDDHSFELESDFVMAKPHHHHKGRAVGPGDTTLIGGPSGVDDGNSAVAGTLNSYNSDTSLSHDDDHSVDISSHHYIGPGDHEHHAPHVEAKPGCTKVHEVVHTVTRTALATETVFSHPQAQHEHAPYSESESHNEHSPSESYSDGGHPNSHSPQETNEYHDSEPGTEHGNNDPYSGGTPIYHSPEDAAESYPTPGSNSNYPGAVEHGNLASGAAAPAATPIYHGAASQAPPLPSNHIYHGPQASAAQASSFQMIPVYVPTNPAVHGSFVIAAPSSSPAPSASYRVAPTGVSPESHGPAMFTGSAVHLAPSAGVVSVFCGVLALLAFVM